MAAPAKFADISKAAKDLFSKNYNFGDTKLEVKTASTTGTEFTATLNKVSKTGAIAGNLETKWKYAPQNITITEKWNTQNQISLEVTSEDKIAKGLKVGFEAGISPSSGNKSAKVSTAIKQERFHITADLDVLAGPVVNTSAVFTHKGFLVGYDAAYNVNASALTKSNLAAGYAAKDFTVVSVLDGARVATSLFHTVNPAVLAAVQFSWNRNTNETTVELGGQYSVDKNTFFKGKVDGRGNLGLSFTQSLRPGVKATLSAQIDGNNLNTDAHKLGFHLLLEA
ncbi:eukaryotic porin [Capsaspora owczarzaki ATCC 30864]|uniref:Eukaryotic porin n=1 Tax=Capsaspora owczarzaki (strain ATCC 30864) TaxID=595528 RepID=A0A0D2WY38_CAPO3|nr:eukaryotic porin [Capsaspora owczarzaki ATCC 30864]KJE97773.1 eukaryotic porin [Capsaspora owczarzaki ATCC 30864]|eukprot:XP_004342960.1 eukaryotic porin [Capsaspora owczarzaki ATCC 30864]